MMTKQPTFFLSHGGGPWPYMEGAMREKFNFLEQSLKAIPQQLPEKPKAILVVSGHWEEATFTLSSGQKPGMVFDYYGFPEYLYHISYPAPGSPELAHRAHGLLTQAGFESKQDPQRGFDHGTFSMMKPIYPKADMPIVQLSLKASMDPAEHIAVGKALAPLRDEGIVIIGSGFSYHNLRLWGEAGSTPAAQFDGWLRKVLLNTTPEAREAALINWETAPAARIAHPKEDHLLPLMVAVGAAGGDPATAIYGEVFMGLAASSFRFSANQTPSPLDQLATTA